MAGIKQTKTCSCMLEAQTSADRINLYLFLLEKSNTIPSCDMQKTPLHYVEAFNWYQYPVVVVKGGQNEVPLLMTSNNSIV